MAKPGCRDCADEYGTCPHDGLPCDPDARRLLQLEADLARVTQERDALRLLVEGKDGLLAAYRIGRPPSAATWKKLEQAKKALGQEESSDQ